MKSSNLLQHLDLSSTLLAERAVHYIVKRLAKSLIIQAVHFSGVYEQITKKTKQFILEILDPINLRNKDRKMVAPTHHHPSNFHNTSFDELILNFNTEFHDHLRSGAEATTSVGSKYILQRMIGHDEIDCYDKGKSRVNFQDIISDSQQSSKANEPSS